MTREFRGWTPGSVALNLVQSLVLFWLASECLVFTVGFWTELLGLPLFVLGCLLGVNRLSRARDARSLAAQLTVHEESLEVDGRAFPSAELGLVHEAISPFVLARYLELYDREGRRLAKFCPRRTDYVALRALLEARCGEPSPVARRRLHMSHGWLFLGMGLGFVAFGLVGLAWFGLSLREIYMLNTQGVEAKADIVKLYRSPNGMNTLVTYRLSGSEHDAILDATFWEGIAEGTSLTVRTVPGHPEMARVPLYEEEQYTPGVLLILGIGGLGVLAYGSSVVGTGLRQLRGLGRRQ